MHPPQGNPGHGDTPAPSLPQAWPWHGQRKDCCFFLVSITCRVWRLLMASQGAHWPSTAEAEAPVLHPSLISVVSTADRTSLVTSSLLETGTQPCWCFCQLRGLALPSTGLATLPRAASARYQCLPWLCQAFPCSLWALSAIPGAQHWRPCREARGGAERYFTGYFTCWHQLFLPSAPNHVPEPLTLPSCLPSHSASSVSIRHRASLQLCHLSTVTHPFLPCPSTHCSESGPAWELFVMDSNYWFTDGTGRGDCCTPGWLLGLGGGGGLKV